MRQKKAPAKLAFQDYIQGIRFNPCKYEVGLTMNKPLLEIGQIILFHGWRSKVIEIKTQDGEFDYLLKPLDDISFCSGRECGVGGCEDCEFGKYRSNWFLEFELKQGLNK